MRDRDLNLEETGRAIMRLQSLRENGIGDLSLTLLKGEQWVDFRRAVMAFQETW
jgi:hypothetical protein